MDLNKLIVGSWADMKRQGANYGFIKDTYHPDGTKTIEITINSFGTLDKYNATAKWNINNKILSEEIIDIDKKAVKKFGFKKGFKNKAYIEQLNTTHLIIIYKTNDRKVHQPVTLTRID
jgi:hypothetical protein